MNEQERFEEWAWNQYQVEVKKHPCLEEITKEELFCFEAGRYYRQDMYYQGLTWQARAEIAKQDEKELIEALDKIHDAQYQPSGPLSGLNTAIRLSRAIIEKHTGKI